MQHASRLDCNSSLVWGHLSLLLLSMGEGRYGCSASCFNFVHHECGTSNQIGI